jgi:hypothetical protein
MTLSDDGTYAIGKGSVNNKIITMQYNYILNH